MRNLEKIKSEKCQAPLFIIFHIPPPGEVIKIYSPL